MAQHFLLSRPAKTLSLAAVFRLTDLQAEAEFRAVRWPDTNGAPVCPECGGLDAYECRRPSGSLRFRCRACRKDFFITSGTLFASHKLPLRMYLGAIAIFCNEVEGKAALALDIQGQSQRRARHSFSFAVAVTCLIFGSRWFEMIYVLPRFDILE